MLNINKRVVITGMSINTPIGDDLDTYYQNLLAGKSAISKWKFFDTGPCYSKIGGDLSEYDWKAKLAALKEKLPPATHKRLRKLVKRAPFSTRLSLLAGADAYADAGVNGDVDHDRVSVVVGGHNLNNNYFFANNIQYTKEPEFIEGMLALYSLDTDEPASVSEALGFRGAIYTTGGACASANMALRNAVDEVNYHDHDMAFVVGAPLDFAAVDLHAMAIMGAISYESFNETPELASRPYDIHREGFIPSHGAAVLVVEDLEHALKRGARIYCEVLGVASFSDGCHLPSPSVEGQCRTMQGLLNITGVKPEEVDYINAHATSTALGDMTEINSIKKVFGDHAYKLKINAPKSMLGHTCWSAPAVETVAAVLQMCRGTLHPSINVDEMDPEIDLDVCANEPVEHPVRTLVKNSFGFGGINCCALLRRYED